MAYGLTMATTKRLTEQLSEILKIPEDVIADAMNEITRIELRRVASDKRELIQTPVLQFQRVEECDDIDTSLYEGKVAC